MNKVRWGVLSTAKIAVKDVIPAMQQGTNSKVVAIASRDPEKAEKVADKLGIEKAYGSYEKLLESNEVDAVYNPLPNHLHVNWSIKALQAGKHVLCEKPIALSHVEAQQLLFEARKYPGLKIMEAFMYRHHPRWKKVRELIRSGAIGELKTVRSFFSYFNDDPDNIRNKPEMGGGSLMDIGCYCISVPRFLFEDEPTRVIGSMEIDPELKIERLTSAILSFPSGSATFTSATQLTRHQSVSVFGTEGKIEIPMPFNPTSEIPTVLHLENNTGEEEISFEPCNQYTLQGDHFSKAIIDDSNVPTGLEDAVANMKVIDALNESNNEGGWVSC
ncbi:Gfo/Idh/MocA family oxidoreductase [Balneolaceae bacterium YR4-1]|uniref:Gfo/Idh/MocA family oxidoreductase n=1 Tax=Halalkalibaculum roseum TaxID=2709311 RepID=A0A6M1SZW3_9BACT|nr:Gfo/Idh/MocA family oxidoreductase [Halalkalibaculum roseum]NGP77948.1 Gfo/Idh/MocA family oxidoreductase [Halalkalibaculum roseum]